MSSLNPHSKRFKLSPRPLQGAPIKPLHTGQHATVNCHACNRIMVPRVISYYGQPLRSICPFCGTTFMKFSSGLQQFVQRFHTLTLSFSAFKWLAIVALCFGLVWFSSHWGILPNNLSLFAAFGTIIFAAFALAELLFQCVEQTAAKMSHESNYYWAALVLVIMVITIGHHDIFPYIVQFSIIMLARGLIAGLFQALRPTR